MRPFVIVFILLSAAAMAGGFAIYHHCAKMPATVDQPQTKNETANTYDAGKDCLYRLYLFATVAGVCVALCGILAIYSQTEATKQSALAASQSARATERSVALQEIALKQWINIGNWSIELDKRHTQLIISFHVINPTHLPLDLHAILIKTGGTGGDIERHDLGMGIADVLAPDNPYIGNVTAKLSGEDVERLIDVEGISIGFQCDVLFADSRGENWQQIFKRMLYIQGGIMQADKPIVPHVMEIRNLLRKSPSPPTRGIAPSGKQEQNSN
jgi:hypothetical protein